MQKILGGPSGSIGSVGGGSDTAGSKTGATEPVTPAPVSPARIGDGPGEQRTGAQSPPVMMSPEMLKTILAESMAMGMQIAGASAEKQAKEQTTPGAMHTTGRWRGKGGRASGYKRAVLFGL